MKSIHDDVIKWKPFLRCWPFVRGIHVSPVNSPYKGQWRGALMFSLICVWINGWVNNREAGDLRRYRAHCDVIVMLLFRIYSGIASATDDLAWVQTHNLPSLIARFMGPAWGSSGADRTQVGPILAPWTLQSIITWLRGFLARNCSGCPWRRQAIACVTMESACQPPSWCQCRYGSSRLCLNLRLIHHKNTLLYVYGDWWIHINHFESDKSLYLHKLAAQFYVPDDVPRAPRPFATGCVKLQLPSLRRDAWRHNGGK